MDNFNVTASRDQFLDVVLKYRCRILFTTRSRYENHISLEVGALNPDTLLELEELKPSVRKCSVLLGGLQEIRLLHGLDFMNNKQVLRGMRLKLNKDKVARYNSKINSFYGRQKNVYSSNL